MELNGYNGTEFDENPFKKENKENFTQKDCTFLLLAKLPNGNIHQVVIKQEEIQKMISDISNFTLIEEPETYIKFDHIQK